MKRHGDEMDEIYRKYYKDVFYYCIAMAGKRDVAVALPMGWYDVLTYYGDENADDEVIRFYIAESIPDHFRLGWRENTCYTKISGDGVNPENVKKVVYTDKDGNALHTLWERP